MFLAIHPGVSLAQDGHDRGRAPVVGSGAPLGLYYPVAGALAGVTADPRVLVESTGGSLENLVRLRAGDLDLAIARSDLVYDAAFGLGPFAVDAPYGELRTVMSLHAEPLLVIAAAGSGIATLDDIDGHRVQLGPAGTATSELFALVLGSQEWPEDRYVSADPVALADQTDGLCAGDYDVMAFISGAPSGTVYDALTRCDAQLVAVEGAAIEGLLTDHPALVPAIVPPGTFPGVEAPIPSIGPVALLVTTVDADADWIADLVTRIVDALPQVRAQHPALMDVDVPWMASVGHVVALHDGAAEAFEARRQD